MFNVVFNDIFVYGAVPAVQFLAAKFSGIVSNLSAFSKPVSCIGFLSYGLVNTESGNMLNGDVNCELFCVGFARPGKTISGNMLNGAVNCELFCVGF